MWLQVRLRSKFVSLMVTDNSSRCVNSHSIVSDYKIKQVGNFWYFNCSVIIDDVTKYCNLRLTSQNIETILVLQA